MHELTAPTYKLGACVAEFGLGVMFGALMVRRDLEKRAARIRAAIDRAINDAIAEAQAEAEARP